MSSLSSKPWILKDFTDMSQLHDGWFQPFQGLGRLVFKERCHAIHYRPRPMDHSWADSYSKCVSCELLVSPYRSTFSIPQQMSWEMGQKGGEERDRWRDREKARKREKGGVRERGEREEEDRKKCKGHSLLHSVPWSSGPAWQSHNLKETQG